VFTQEYNHCHESELSPKLDMFVSHAGVLGRGVCYSRVVGNKDCGGK
jgi:hypothetical protein